MSVLDAGSAAATLLESERLAWLTTVRADGQPQSSYVWFHSDGNNMVVLSRPNAGKVRNIRANPKVSFHLNGDDRGGRVLTIDAVAEIVAGDPDPDRIQAYVTKYDAAIRSALGTTPDEIRADYSTVVVITPSRVRSW
jgi:PPOX class probable F420-dependent enzyme